MIKEEQEQQHQQTKKHHHHKEFILPGQALPVQNAKINKNSFYQEGSQVRALYFGVLHQQDIGGHQYYDIIKKVTTYMPEKNQFVVGVVRQKQGEGFTVDINAPLEGSLGGLEFDGATKRNRPNLAPGDMVYTRIASYSRHLGAKLSCTNPGWSAGKALGELKGGMIVYGLRGREKLLEERLQEIGRHCKLEVALGKNDILWFSCPHPRQQMLLYNIFTHLFKGGAHQTYQSLLQLLSSEQATD